MKLFFILTLVLVTIACSPKQEVDRLFINGTIHTGVDNQPLAQLIAVDDGRIVHVGTTKDANSFNAAQTTDLSGAHLFAGFTDGHAHLFGIGQREVNLNLENTASLAEMLQTIKQVAQDNPKGAIIGRGWIETHWPKKRFPNRYDLEAVASGRIVLLSRSDGHALLASTAALQAIGIDADSVDPEGGRINRDSDGTPNGLLIDTAMNLMAPLLQGVIGEDRQVSLAKGAQVMATYGWTGIHNMSVTADDVIQLEAMAKAGTMPIRIYNGIVPEDIDLLADGPRFSADKRVITRAIKIVTDGALGSRGAALLAPYSDDPTQSGLMISTSESMIPILQQALEEGWQINAHAIGDRANRQLLDWMEQAFNSQSTGQQELSDPRWRIEHAQIINPQDLERFAELGIIPSMQASHAIGDLFFAEDRLGKSRLQGAYAWASLLKSGTIIVGGSDAPVERGDPRIEFYAAVSRTAINGFQGANWHKEQAVTRREALKMFTLWPAIASFREDDLGTIEVGKRADFTIFDRDLMTIPAEEILTAKVLWTIVDGKDSYKANPSMQ
ncbi:MAG: amidohydrolase [Robiginitomaculum sp.]|nr:amidohydrolase [Robiginitomaculum sp.]